MIVWLLIGALSLAVGGWLLRPLVRPGGIAAGAGLLVMAALVGGVIFYALTSDARLASAPAAPPPGATRATATEMESARQDLLKNVGDTDGWVRLASAMTRSGETHEANEALSVALTAMPNRPELWIAKGEALVAHAGGLVTPAARLAFDRASVLAPGHPAPRYYLGLSWLQAGKPREALAEWQSIAKASKPNAPWMAELNRKMEAAQMMIDAGVGGATP